MKRVFLLTLLAVAAAGCGGNGSTGTANRLSHAEFVRQGNAVCARYDRKLSALQPPNDLAGIASYAKRAAALASAELDALERLSPPSADERPFAQFVAEGRSEVKLVGTQMRAAAARGDAAAVRDVAARVQRMDKRVDRLATQAGLTRCARPTPS